MKDIALITKREIENDSDESESVHSSERVANSQLTHYTIGAYIPCGHCLVHDKRHCSNKSWEETFATVSSRYEINLITGVPNEECQSCGAIANAILRLYIEPSKGIIASGLERVRHHFNPDMKIYASVKYARATHCICMLKTSPYDHNHKRFSML